MGLPLPRHYSVLYTGPPSTGTRSYRARRMPGRSSRGGRKPPTIRPLFPPAHLTLCVTFCCGRPQLLPQLSGKRSIVHGIAAGTPPYERQSFANLPLSRRLLRQSHLYKTVADGLPPTLGYPPAVGSAHRAAGWTAAGAGAARDTFAARSVPPAPFCRPATFAAIGATS